MGHISQIVSNWATSELLYHFGAASFYLDLSNLGLHSYSNYSYFFFYNLGLMAHISQMAFKWSISELLYYFGSVSFYLGLHSHTNWA